MAILTANVRTGQGQWLSASEAAAVLGVSRHSIQNYCDRGELEYRTTLGGHRRVSRSSLNRWLGLDENEQDERGTVVYARCSQQKQVKAGNLKRQVERLVEHCGREYGVERSALTVIAECGSGLKEDRKGYLRLIDLVLSGRVARVVVEFADRLARYGVKVFQALCDRMGVELVIAGAGDDDADQSPEAEMTADILSLCTVYSARIHGRRGGDATRLEVTPEARERILQLHRNGLTQTAIAEAVQGEGWCCPRTGKPYAIHSVRLVLRTAAALKGILTGEAEGGTMLQRFVRERCVQGEGLRVFTKPFLAAFLAYAQENGQPWTGTDRQVVKAMRRQGHSVGRNGSGYFYYQGLRLA